MTNLIDLRPSFHDWLSHPSNGRLWAAVCDPVGLADRPAALLQLADESVFFWEINGSARDVARAELMRAHVQAKCGEAKAALPQALSAFDLLFSKVGSKWEQPYSHAVLAHLYHATRDEWLHRHYYEQAKAYIDKSEDSEEKTLLECLLRQVPSPTPLPLVQLSEFERWLLRTLIAGETEKDVLAKQVELISSVQRQATGPGFYTYLNLPTDGSVCRMQDRRVETTGMYTLRHPALAVGAYAALYFEDGVMTKLEGVTIDTQEKWPADESLFEFETF